MYPVFNAPEALFQTEKLPTVPEMEPLQGEGSIFYAYLCWKEEKGPTWSQPRFSTGSCNSAVNQRVTHPRPVC